MVLLILLVTCISGTSAATLSGLKGLKASSGMPKIQNLDAKCGRSGMTVHVVFDQPFPGVIYSKGHYSNAECNYVSEKSSGGTKFT